MNVFPSAYHLRYRDGTLPRYNSNEQAINDRAHFIRDRGATKLYKFLLVIEYAMVNLFRFSNRKLDYLVSLAWVDKSTSGILNGSFWHIHLLPHSGKVFQEKWLLGKAMNKALLSGRFTSMFAKPGSASALRSKLDGLHSDFIRNLGKKDSKWSEFRYELWPIPSYLDAIQCSWRHLRRK